VGRNGEQMGKENHEEIKKKTFNFQLLSKLTNSTSRIEGCNTLKNVFSLVLILLFDYF
jgi:hypothetical protein